jgi:phosphoenolpyruvate carboxykinase (GTP)
MGDYFAHWLKVGASAKPENLPRLYYVNWFRQDAGGKFLWPGYGDNSRVLKWVFERVTGGGAAIETPIGNLPAVGALDVKGLDIAPGALDVLLKVDAQGWLDELPLMKQHYESFGDRLPAGLWTELASLEKRLLAAKAQEAR